MSAVSPMSEIDALRKQVEELESAKQGLEIASLNLTRALEAAAAGSQAKSQFLATMSHELRTPLNAIIGFSEILKDEIFGPVGSSRYRDYAASIHKSGSHLLGLINDILDISKFDAGRLDLREEDVDVAKLIAESVQLMEAQARISQVALRAHAGEGSIHMRGDERRLRQVLLNLLSNALKFTPEGGAVDVAATEHDGVLAIAVIDSGIGIAPEDIPRALERFGQIDSTLSRKYQGTGLGLPLAKHLTELHGGRLTLASEVGVGTTVTITIPRDRVIASDNAAQLRKSG